MLRGSAIAETFDKDEGNDGLMVDETSINRNVHEVCLNGHLGNNCAMEGAGKLLQVREAKILFITTLCEVL